MAAGGRQITTRGTMTMRVSGISLVAGVLSVSVPSLAQDYGPSQNRLWAQIYRAQFPFAGLYTRGVDGRPNRKAGFPPRLPIEQIV
jgi:hypothetical protein